MQDPSPTGPSWADRRVVDVMSRLGGDYAGPLTVHDLAASVNLSTSRLQHLFRTVTGDAVMRSLRTQRLRAAAKMLRGTHLRVSEVCYAVGFCNTAHFSHAFKRQYGVSPRIYRQRQDTEVAT
jgi:transcriptional regulator GlxA family with amidase domain